MPPRLRREFLKLGSATAAAATLARPQAVTAAATPRLRTSLCELFGIEVPIVQSGMGGVAGPELAAAVSRAGGLGIIAATMEPPDAVRAKIRKYKTLSDRPFGVNLLLHSQVWPPADMSKVPDSVVRSVQTVLDTFRARLGLPASADRPPSLADYVPAVLDVLLEERVPVFSVGLGNPPADLVRRFQAQGAKVIAMVASVEDAREVAKSGIDAVVAQGHEAGGHRSTWTKRPSAQHAAVGTMALVPEVVAAVDVPVIAAGGITGGRGVVASLALGAKGVMLGTRFVATRESMASDFYKQALIDAQGDATMVTDAYSGLYARILRNTFASEYEASGAPLLPAYVQSAANRDIVAAARERKDRSYAPLWAGQGVGMIKDQPSAADVLRAVVEEATAVLRSLPSEAGVRA
jgi:nitronate monooxygenase